MDLQPLKGIGPVRFGMRPGDVAQAMGEEQVYEAWMGGNLNDSQYYRGLLLGFDSCSASGPLPDSVLIEVFVRERAGTLLWGRGLSEWTVETLSQEATLHGHDFTIDNHGRFRADGLSILCTPGPDSHIQEANIDWPFESWPEAAKSRSQRRRRRWWQLWSE